MRWKTGSRVRVAVALANSQCLPAAPRQAKRKPLSITEHRRALACQRRAINDPQRNQHENRYQKMTDHVSAFPARHVAARRLHLPGDHRRPSTDTQPKPTHGRAAGRHGPSVGDYGRRGAIWRRSLCFVHFLWSRERLRDVVLWVGRGDRVAAGLGPSSLWGVEAMLRRPRHLRREVDEVPVGVGLFAVDLGVAVAAFGVL